MFWNASRRAVAITGLFGLAAMATGCESPQSAEQFRPLAEQLCGARAECCGSGGEAVECVATEMERWEARVKFADREELTFDAGCVDQRQSWMRRVACNANSGAIHPCTQHCNVFYGERRAGQRCFAYDDQTSTCGQGLLCLNAVCTPACDQTGAVGGESCELGCAIGFDCSVDRCARAPGSGQSCTASCQPGYSCVQGTCAAWQVGFACSGVENCGGRGLFCDGGTCQRLKSKGDACVSGRVCASQLCVQDRCADSLPSGVGDRCGRECAGELECWGGECVRPVSVGGVCDGAAPCSDGAFCNRDGRCQAFGEAGDDCESTSRCQAGLRCVDDICVEKLADGEPCTSVAQCASGFCPRGSCRAAPADGEPCILDACGASSECVGGICRPAGPDICRWMHL